jgi:aminoglycoside/choline kinase family phosphotransferase
VTLVSPSIGQERAELSEHKLAELVRRAFGAELVAVAIPGGARTRRYFRLELPEGKSAVAMFDPERGRPEEVQRGYDGARRWPFLEVRDLLAEHGIDVPQILAEDTAHGWLVIEDLGDETLAKWLLKNPAEREPMYQRAVRDLARAQNELAALPEGCALERRSFDYELLRWEIEHFREWALDARDKRLAPEDVPRWKALADRFAQRVAELPSGFVHRDYQSRNLMVVPQSDGGRRLVWIDFQDAVLGPRVYDLVSLLNDSYQDFDRAFVEARLEDYADAAALSRGFTAESRSGLAREFDLVTVQRKFKDAGRFVFIDRQHGNSAFLKFVGPAIRKIAGALDRLAPHDPEMRELRKILERALGDEMP